MSASYPEIIEFQTHNLCNADCIVCPYPEVAKEVDRDFADHSLVDSILDFVSQSNGGVKRLIPYLNNEPFLDKNLIVVLRRIKERFPNIEVELSTNLSAFKEEVIEEIIRDKLVDDFRISFFGGNQLDYEMMMPKLKFEKSKTHLKKLQAIHEKLNSETSIQVVAIASELIDVELNLSQIKNIVGNYFKVSVFGYLDRAGNNQEKNGTTWNQGDFTLDGCSRNRNSERMCILSNGNTVLCSQDWRSHGSYGNVLHDGLSEIWFSNDKVKMDNMVSGCTSSPDEFICKKCKLANLKIADDEIRSLNFLGDKYVDETDQKRIFLKSLL